MIDWSSKSGISQISKISKISQISRISKITRLHSNDYAAMNVSNCQYFEMHESEWPNVLRGKNPRNTLQCHVNSSDQNGQNTKVNWFADWFSIHLLVLWSLSTIGYCLKNQPGKTTLLRIETSGFEYHFGVTRLGTRGTTRLENCACASFEYRWPRFTPRSWVWE
jgi:hypothetical protein